MNFSHETVVTLKKANNLLIICIVLYLKKHEVVNVALDGN